MFSSVIGFHSSERCTDRHLNTSLKTNQRPHYWYISHYHRHTHNLQTYVRRPWLIVLLTRIFIQCSCLIASPRGYESALWRTQMLLPNAGRKIPDWLSCGFIQCANIQVLIARSITASVHKFGGCGYDDKHYQRKKTYRTNIKHDCLFSSLYIIQSTSLEKVVLFREGTGVFCRLRLK